MEDISRLLQQKVSTDAPADRRFPPPLQIGERVRLYNLPGIYTVLRVTLGSATVTGRAWVKEFDVLDKKTGGYKTVPGHWAKATLPPISRYSFVTRVGDDEVDETLQDRNDDNDSATPDQVRVRTNSPYEGKRGRHPLDCKCSTHLSREAASDSVRETEDEVSRSGNGVS